MSSEYPLWSEDIWLPPNVTWEFFQDDDNYAQFHHLLYPIPAALIVIVIRVMIERIIFRPLGKLLGLKQPVVIKEASTYNGKQNKKLVEEKKLKKWIKKDKKRISTLGERDL